MKTTSLVFGLLFAILGICATIGVTIGETHQIVMAIPSFVMAYALINESSRKSKKLNISK